MTPFAVGRKAKSGFANPEYLIALTGLALLAAVAVPFALRFQDRRRNLGALSELRGALARYAEDTKMKGPASLADLTTGGKYLAAMPTAGMTGLHRPSARVSELGVTDDSGGWSYSNWPGDPRQGQVWINCTHTDRSGRRWNEY
jgi:hypothetical protein